MIEPGKILQQRYRIEKQIGQGGMGAVYVATDERFGSTVAIKETLCMDDNYRKAIEREARLLNSLKHPALPRVSDHFLEENGQFLVMEYIPGEDLSCVLEHENKPFPVDQVLGWADQLLDALDFLHNQNDPVIHRDIKPQNLKVTLKGQIVLLDFGLAKGNPTDAANKTASKSIFGYSRNYASLEQIQGTGTDPRSDLYSLAATLYHLLTNIPPEDALTRAMAVLGHRPDPLIPANGLEQCVPPGVAVVLQKSLALNAEARPGSAAELRQMLKEHENYAYLAESVSEWQQPVPADIFSQKTKLLPGTTRQVAAQTDVKTRILPGSVSQVTAVRTSGTTGTERKTSSVLTKAAGLALLLAGAAAGGAFLYQPTIVTEPEGPVEKVLTLPEAKAPALPSAPVEAVTAPVEEITAEAESGSAKAVSAAAAPPAKVHETVKATRRAQAEAEKSEADFEKEFEEKLRKDLETMVIDGKTVRIGNMKIVDGKIVTPEGIVVGDGAVPKAPPVPGVHKTGVPIQWEKYMTPEQRQKLRMLRRQNREVPKNSVWVSPPPKPTP
jgi:serine/threonine protein kinase